MSPVRGERRRSKGWTNEPCHGCGDPKGHPTGAVCQACQGLLANAKVVLAQAEQARLAGGTQPYGWAELSHWIPGYYGQGDLDSAVRDELRNAMFNLVNLVSQPATPDTPAAQCSEYKNFKAWPRVLETGPGPHARWDGQVLILLRPEVRDAIDRLDAVFREALASTYLTGKKNGRSVLMGLAEGEVSLTDFNDSILTPEERAAAEKARRNY